MCFLQPSTMAEFHLHREGGGGASEPEEVRVMVRIMHRNGTVFKCVSINEDEWYSPEYPISLGPAGARAVKVGSMTRSEIIENCVAGESEGGSFTIEVEIQAPDNTPQFWVPKSTMSKDFAHLFESGDGADVSLVVGSKKERIVAHRSILLVRAPTLAALCLDGAADVEIDDVDEELFKAMLRFAYDDVFEPPATTTGVRSLLQLADRFGCVQLKLHAETCLAEAGVSNNEAAEMLLFADGHSCPQLKELARDVLVSDLPAVMASEGWKRVAESPALLSECMLHMHSEFSGASAAAAAAAAPGPKSMKVTELRRALEARGLECDGSREMLEQRLLDPPPPSKKARIR